MMMHRTRSGRLLSHDSIVAFLEENSWNRSVYDIKNKHLVYRDSSKRLRSIDLDLIPSLDDTEGFFTPPTVRRYRRPSRCLVATKNNPLSSPNDDIARCGLEHRRAEIESLAASCMFNEWDYQQLVHAICALLEGP